MNENLVAVVGATGVTGGLAFDAAERLGLAPLALGRDRAKLQAFLAARSLPDDRLRTLDIGSAATVKSAFEGTKIVISTVAPFLQNGFEIARAAVELGLGYTDPSGEGGFIQRMIAELDAPALASGATLCTGNGAAAFLGDIGLRKILDPLTDRTGGVVYDIRNYRPSWGSMRSYIESILPSGGACIRAGKVEMHPMASFAGTVAGITGYNTVVPDALIVSRYWHPEFYQCLAKSGALPRGLISLLVSAMTGTALSRAMMKLPLEKWLAHDPAKDAQSTVTAHVEVGSRSVSVTASGVYPFTGRVLAATAKAMLAHTARPAGVRAASEMFASFEEALSLTGAKAE